MLLSEGQHDQTVQLCDYSQGLAFSFQYMPDQARFVCFLTGRVGNKAIYYRCTTLINTVTCNISKGFIFIFIILQAPKHSLSKTNN